jgi:dUTP pyrophosphatase
MKVKIVNKGKHSIPEYATNFSAGMDIRANISETIYLQPLERKLISTGLYLELPEGFEAQIRPRSGLAIKKGLTVLNSPGTIDSDYRGEIGIILVNISSEVVSIEDGERICQMVLAKHEKFEFLVTDEISSTVRGEGGFGHTGVK